MRWLNPKLTINYNVIMIISTIFFSSSVTSDNVILDIDVDLVYFDRCKRNCEEYRKNKWNIYTTRNISQ